MMNEEPCLELIGRILESLGNTVNEVERSLFSRDARRLTQAEKRLAADLKSSLPLCETLIVKKEHKEDDRPFLALLSTLQRLGIATKDLLHGTRTALGPDISLTNKAVGEIGEVVALVRDLARDAFDALAARNARFRQYAGAEASRVIERAERCGQEHEQRLIDGACSPKASFIYLGIMRSLERIARELASLAEKA